MLAELLLSLRSKSSSLAKKSGLLHEQIAIYFREKRCRPEWMSHRNKCEEFIIDAIKGLPHKNRVLILGSGQFLEIPLKRLSDEFKEVVAVDIVHLPQTRGFVKTFSNVKLVEQDLTGWLYKIQEKPISKAGWLNVEVPSYFQAHDLDLVISANLLSQLHLAPKRVLESLPKKHHISENEIEKFCQSITDAHLQYLKNFNNSRIVLISDLETFALDRHKNVLEESRLPFQTKLPNPQKMWLWDVAPLGEISSEYSLQMKVAGFILDHNKTV